MQIRVVAAEREVLTDARVARELEAVVLAVADVLRLCDRTGRDLHGLDHVRHVGEEHGGGNLGIGGKATLPRDLVIHPALRFQIRVRYCRAESRAETLERG